jgi:hypothetical protein
MVHSDEIEQLSLTVAQENVFLINYWGLFKTLVNLGKNNDEKCKSQ